MVFFVFVTCSMSNIETAMKIALAGSNEKIGPLIISPKILENLFEIKSKYMNHFKSIISLGFTYSNIFTWS